MIVCWGEILWDLYPDEPRLGGAPANVAYHLAALGEPVLMVSAVGDDARGHEARARLAASGVDIRGVNTRESLPTGSVQVAVVDGEARYTLRRGCAWEYIDAPIELLAPATGFCFGTLSQLEPAAMRRLETAISALPAECLKVCDINLRPQYAELELSIRCMRLANVVKLNDAEERLLAAHTGANDAAAWLLEHLGVELVAVTRGPRGCQLRAASGEVADQPGVLAAAGGDNVGAGDAFTAVLTSGLLARKPLNDIAAAANRYGSFIASQRGATPVVPREWVAQLWPFSSTL